MDALTFGIALVGAILGVINTWKAIDRDRPKLRVTFKHAIPVGGADPRIRYCIEVLNLSAFPLTITEVGVLLRGTKARGAVTQPLLFDGGSWPRRLEPRTSVTGYLREDAFRHEQHPIRCAYAKTDCDLIVKGKSAAMRQVAGEVNARLRGAR